MTTQPVLFPVLLAADTDLLVRAVAAFEAMLAAATDSANRFDRARKNLDRHPNYILAAYMASGVLERPVLPRCASGPAT